jgi:hypothetical protein
MLATALGANRPAMLFPRTQVFAGPGAFTSALLMFLLLSASSSGARADAANDYGARGRTVVSGGLWGSLSNVRAADAYGHDTTWLASEHLTLVHFWVDNFAVGGTLSGGAAHLDDGFRDRPSRSWVGADVDVIAHVPLSRRLSLRFWLWEGVRWSHYNYSTNVDHGGAITRVSLVSGLSPNLLLHLSPSVAITFGPSLTLTAPIQGRGPVDFYWSVGPGMTYSFGPSSSGTALEPAKRFAARGRTALQLYAVLNEDQAFAGVGFVRFLIQGFGLGAYGSLGPLSGATDSHSYAGGGLSAMGDLPLIGSVSILLAPQVGYMWRQQIYEESESVHELQLNVPLYLAMHLHEGLVFGVGPSATAHLRLVERGERDQPNDVYLQGGVASLLTGSF